MSQRRHPPIHRRTGEIVLHKDFGDRDTVPAELMPDDPLIPVPEVRELFGEAAQRAVLEAASQLKWKWR